MHINNNVQKIAIENILNQIGEVYTKIGDEVILYPLRIVSGITQFTEHGEFGIKYNSDSFTSDIAIINSNEPIVCYWEGAFTSYVPDSEIIPNADFQLKWMSADDGRKVKTWIMQYSTETVTSEQIINENAYTTISLNRNIRSFSTEWIPTDNEQKYYLYLYLDKKAKSPQFLQMVSKEPRYLPGGKLAGCEMAFINLNQTFSQSGKDILNFVKMTHPGGSYPFPKEIQTSSGKEVILDFDKINNRGVNDIQLYFYNSYWLNSITVYGAPKSNWKIEAPRRLLLCNPHPAISSALEVSGSALNNYYAVFGAQTLYQSFWNTWKDKVQAYYDYGAEKKFMGGFKLGGSETWQSVIDTNPIANDCFSYNMWNNWSFHPNSDITFSTPETPFTGSSISFYANQNYKPEDFLNHNSFIYGAMEAMPMEFSETTRYTLGDFGALGRILQGFVQVFTLGFNPGWTTNNTWVPNKSVNFLIPTSTFNFGRLMTAEGSSVGSAPIPFDCANPEFSGCGNKNCVCGYRFQLTRYFQSPSQTIAGNVSGKGGSGIWDTKYLWQDKFEDGSWIFQNHAKVQWISDCRAISPLTQNEEYEVYLASYKGVGLTDCRMTFFNYINNNPANVESVWESRQMTNAKFKNDITLWTNTYKLSFSEEMNNEGVINYPTNVVPPNPQSSSIRINELEGEYNKDDKTKYVAPFYYRLDNLFKEGKILNYGVGFTQYILGWHGPHQDIPHGTLNVCYIQPYIFKTNKTIDLTQKIGVGKLNQYQSFSFIFKSLHSQNYDYVKNMTVNIADCVDNQWTKFKVADIEELVSFANGDAYPNNKGKFSGLTTPTYECYGNFNQWYSNAPAATDIYFWVKLNKTSQVLEIAFDNPTNDDTTFGDYLGNSPISYYNPSTVTITKNIPKTSITNDLTLELYKLKFNDVTLQQGAVYCPSIRIRKSQLDFGTTINNWFEIPQDVSGGRIFAQTTTTSDANNYIITTNITFDVHKDETAEIEIKYWNDFINRTTIRNMNISHDIDLHILDPKYNDNTFFRGYVIQDFFINPNS